MSRRRLHRLTTAFFAVLSLLLAQFAVAGYACPVQDNAAAMAEMVASGLPCEGMDKAQPALCHEHGASTAQSFEAAKLPAPSLPMLVQVLELPLVLDAEAAATAPSTGARDARPPPDPLFLATLRLRV